MSKKRMQQAGLEMKNTRHATKVPPRKQCNATQSLNTTATACLLCQIGEVINTRMWLQMMECTNSTKSPTRIPMACANSTLRDANAHIQQNGMKKKTESCSHRKWQAQHRKESPLTQKPCSSNKMQRHHAKDWPRKSHQPRRVPPPLVPISSREA